MQKISRSKKILFSLIVLLIIYGLLELLTFAVYSLVDQRFFSFNRFRKERASIKESAQFDAGPEDGAVSYIDHGIGYRNWKVYETIHPYLGFVQDPARTRGRNEWGFPGRESPISSRSEDRLIIGIFGGSFAHALSRYGQDDIINELRKIPGFAEKEIVFHTIAMGGYKQPQQLLALTYLLSLGAEFDIIINIDGFNEIALSPLENIPKGVNPFYPRNWFVRVQGLSDGRMLMMAGEISILGEERRSRARTFSKFPLRFSVICNLLWKYLDQRLSYQKNAIELALQQYKIESSEKVGYISTGPPFHYDSEAELYRVLTDYWKRCSSQMARLCAINGIAYFHFLQPNQHVPGSKIMKIKEWKKAVGKHPVFKPIVEAGYPFLISKGNELSEEGVSFHDLTMIFKGNDEYLYIDDCCHVNEKGCGIIAETIGKKIAEKIRPAGEGSAPVLK